ncbi:MAG TPA: alpha/beta hydrolase [Pyrinomonadaceae bacterium]|nr:alpha/beta hydrolase [Pyrinomonadaceae bacterium]
MIRREFIAVTAATLASGAVSAYVFPMTREQAPAAQRPLNASAFHAGRQYADTSFGRIAYVERGKGDAALFLHGFPLNSFQWRGALERLAEYRRCIAPDFMALGYTEVVEGQSVAPDAQVAMLTSFLDNLSIPKVDVVASDSGGAVAQLLLARHPERIRTLLLTNCDAENDSPPPVLLPVIEMARAGTWVDQTLAPQLADKALARSAKGIGGLCYVDPGHPSDEAIDYYFGPLVSSPRRKALVHSYAIALERNPLTGIEPLLKRSTVPTRIVWGMADQIFSSRSPDYLSRVFGDSRGVRRLAGRKLFFPEEIPNVIAEEARRLWQVA